MKVKVNAFIGFFSGILLLLLSYLNPLYNISIYIMGFSIIVISAYLLYLFRNNVGLFICMFFILYSNYSIVMGVYFFPEIRPDVLYLQVTDKEVYLVGMRCLFIFMWALLIFIVNMDIKAYPILELKDAEQKVPYNNVFSLVCMIAVFILLITGFQFGTNGARASNTTLYEYRIIPFIIGMMYSKKNKVLQALWLILLILTCGVSFIGGNRADAIPPVIAYLCIYHPNIKPKKLLIVLVAGCIFMVSIGVFRASVLQNQDLSLVFATLIHDKGTFNTAVWAYFPSICTLDLSLKMPFSEKLSLLLGQVIYIFGGKDFSYYNLTFVSKKYYFHTNGFVSVTYFYFWFGLLGALLFAWIVFAYIKAVSKRKRHTFSPAFRYELFIYFVSTVPRWYLYGPYGIIRGSMLFSIAYFLFCFVSRLLTAKVMHRSIHDNNLSAKTKNQIEL